MNSAVVEIDVISLLTSRMLEGDEAAFTRFYEGYCDRLYRYLIVLTRGEEDLARELLQLTMTKAVRSMQPFPTEGQLWAWLTTIARHCYIDLLRRRQRAPALVSLLPDDLPQCADEDEQAPLFEALDTALAGLPASEKDLLKAFYFDGETHLSIARQRGSTPKAVESKLARLRQKLRIAILRHLHHENS